MSLKYYINGSLTDVTDMLLKAMDKPTLIEKSITANGVYNAADDGADGYSAVTVNVFPGGYVTSGLRFSVKDQPLTMNVYDLSEDNIYLGNGFSISMALIISDTTKDLSYVSRYGVR